MKTYCKSICVVILGLMLAAGCGDSAAEPEDTNKNTSEVDCPRLELEEFDDCTYEGDLYLNDREDLEAFCNSSCNSARHPYLNSGYPSSSVDPTDLSVLRGLEHVGSLEINAVDSLKSLDGLEDLKEVEQYIRIRSNYNLESVEGLSSLERVGADFQLQGAHPVKDLTGLESLREVGSITLSYNEELASIEALYNLETIENGIRITNNPNLPTCQAEELKERMSLPDEEVRISGNGGGTCE